MSDWRSSEYFDRGRAAGVPDAVLTAAIAAATAVKANNPRLPPVFTLSHLAQMSDVPHLFLRSVVSRQLMDPYRVFQIRKRSGQGFRTICVPSPPLRAVQRWICSSILRWVEPHEASTAYAKGSDLPSAAAAHCGARWLIKLDLANFFSSISEVSVYKVFRRMGYQPLISFEMARICTRLAGGRDVLGNHNERWRGDLHHYGVIPDYQEFWQGHLPQGAPTSPMLSNLAMAGFDEAFERLAMEFSLVYTRYADDLQFSTRRGFCRDRLQKFLRSAYAVMPRFGMRANAAKTSVSPPGSRKVVLGLNVSGDRPAVLRATRDMMRMHLHYLERDDVGPVRHATARGFSSVAGMREYLVGVAAFVTAVDAPRGRSYSRRLAAVPWPV